MNQETEVSFEEIAPWGRSFDEYCRMFDLFPDDLPDAILDCGGGPSSFCAVAVRRGARVVSVDPLYQFSEGAIRQRINQITPEMLRLMHDERERFELDQYGSPEAVVEGRHRAMEAFLDDYEEGKKDGRYRVDSMMDLDFEDDEFDLALSSHFLFLYDEKLPLEQHLEAIREALRVAGELRVYPLKNMQGESSRVLPDVMEQLRRDGYRREIREVPYEFQRGAREMLVVQK